LQPLVQKEWEKKAKIIQSLHKVFNPTKNKTTRAKRNAANGGRKKKQKQKKESSSSSSSSSSKFVKEKRPAGPFFVFAKVMRNSSLPELVDLKMSEKSKAMGAM
jgi:hypothetical protein|tara:strand:+ start:723 stop:1034 length:312 start_codon:yes stop_codon:yes gene_type:complete